MTEFVEEPLENYVSNNDFPNVIDAIKRNKSSLPFLRFDCGVSDKLIEPNRLLHQQLTDLDIPHVYQEFDGGHEWMYWQKHIEDTFLFFDSVLKRIE
jgi:enterochelin esterase-like enzyme